MADTTPIDIHYAKLESWLLDRREVLEKKNKKTFAEVLRLAPLLVQRARVDIPRLKKSQKKLQGMVDEGSRRREDCIRRCHKIELERASVLADVGLQLADGFSSLEVNSALQSRLGEVQAEFDVLLQRELEEARPALEGGFEYFLNVLSVTGVPNEHLQQSVWFPMLSRALQSGPSVADSSGSLRLHSDETRLALLDDLAAVKVFFKERVHENAATSSDVAMIAVSVPELCRARRQGQSIEEFIIEAIQKLETIITDKRWMQLLRMASSHRHAERFLASVEQLTFGMFKQKSSMAHWEEHAAKASDELNKIEPQLDSTIRSVRDDAARCETFLREMFHPREVYLNGDIHSL